MRRMVREPFASHAMTRSISFVSVVVFSADPVGSGPRSNFCSGCAFFGGLGTDPRGRVVRMRLGGGQLSDGVSKNGLVIPWSGISV